ncbi:hypothetical protein PFNF135_05240 [Plasmodium falciparum NF135/5.C10]|uniref:Rab-GAP TBC domain-containing protein n=1 Tax=Plasmodium falciparum NF135/5.C10 TaxID=1036726 RepID=W4I9M9_PLAFA|nr:hypothetical protein PFNF135_05240 [Plasmodium falciparum NF135/5.C10]
MVYSSNDDIPLDNRKDVIFNNAEKKNINFDKRRSCDYEYDEEENDKIINDERIMSGGEEKIYMSNIEGKEKNNLNDSNILDKGRSRSSSNNVFKNIDKENDRKKNDDIKDKEESNNIIEEKDYYVMDKQMNISNTHKIDVENEKIKNIHFSMNNEESNIDDENKKENIFDIKKSISSYGNIKNTSDSHKKGSVHKSETEKKDMNPIYDDNNYVWDKNDENMKYGKNHINNNNNNNNVKNNDNNMYYENDEKFYKREYISTDEHMKVDKEIVEIKDEKKEQKKPSILNKEENGKKNKDHVIHNVEEAPGYEYSHNIIYHELYVELLHVNKNLQNEIKNLKKIIEMQKILIKSKEEVFLDHLNEKNKMSNKKLMNHNYFLNFFNKKKKKSKEYKTSFKEEYEEEEDDEDIGYVVDRKKQTYFDVNKNYHGGKRELEEEIHNVSEEHFDKKGSYLECEKIYNDDEDMFEYDMDVIYEKEENKNNKYIKLPSIDNNDFSEMTDRDIDSLYAYNNNNNNNNNNNRNHNKNNNNSNNNSNIINIEKNDVYFFNDEKEESNYSRKYEFEQSMLYNIEVEDESCNNSMTIQEITCLTFWYEEILPLVNNDKKKNLLINRMITNYMPNSIKGYFWEMCIKNKLNLTEYFVQILIKNTNFIQAYVYTNNRQYHNHVSRYFKSLIELRNNNLHIKEETIENDQDIEQKHDDNNIIFDKKMSNMPNSNANINLLQKFSVQKFFYQILIDLDRTMYIITKNKEYFAKYNIQTDNVLSSVNLSDMKKKLNTLLQMYVLFKPELGYVQGMSYIALVFLLYSNLEKAFVHFANFMERKDIYNLYSFNKEEIKIYIYTIKQILTKRNIEVYKEIVKHYNIDNIFIQWIYTIFLTCLPFNIYIRLFDIYTFNEKIIYEVIICIFTYFNKYHPTDNVDIIIKDLSSFAFNSYIKEEKFWNLLKKIKIKKRKILYYKDKYFNKMNSKDDDCSIEK